MGKPQGERSAGREPGKEYRKPEEKRGAVKKIGKEDKEPEGKRVMAKSQRKEEDKEPREESGKAKISGRRARVTLKKGDRANNPGRAGSMREEKGDATKRAPGIGSRPEREPDTRRRLERRDNRPERKDNRPERETGTGKREIRRESRPGREPGARKRVGRRDGRPEREPDTRRRLERRDGRPGRELLPRKRPVRRGGEPEGEGDAIRLNRYIALSGICSRRDADALIASGNITVNGKVVREMGIRVSGSDDIRYKGKRLRKEKRVYLLLNKPKGFVTTTDDPHAERTVMDLIKGACSERVFPVGRLDKSTTGVLLLTNDGELTARLTHPRYKKKKIYHVWLDREMTKNDLISLTTGVDLEDGNVAADAAAFVEEGDRKQIGIEIHSGQNRVIRRMIEAMGYSVEKLDRVYFAGLTKRKVQRGKWRLLTDKEVIMLKRGRRER